MTNKSNIYGCRKCFQKFKLAELSDTMQFCQNCQNSSVSTSYKQCNYCKGDYKNTIPDEICVKCKKQLLKHGEPSNCTICKLQMVFGNSVICVRCSHYRSKFGEARECSNCCQMSAFYKDNISREKVEGKILCWLCTYYYKLYKCKIFKNSREKRVDVSKPMEVSAPIDEMPLTRNDSSNTLLKAEPIIKRSRVDDDHAMLMYSNDSVYNDHLLKVNSLQEDIKQFRRRIITKDNELLAKDNLITGLKADMFEKLKDFQEKEMALKDRWEKERRGLTEKIRALQRENVQIIKSKKKRRPMDAGFHYLSKNPLTRAVPQSVAVDSPEVLGLARGAVGVEGTISKDVSSADDSPDVGALRRGGEGINSKDASSADDSPDVGALRRGEERINSKDASSADVSPDVGARRRGEERINSKDASSAEDSPQM